MQNPAWASLLFKDKYLIDTAQWCRSQAIRDTSKSSYDNESSLAVELACIQSHPKSETKVAHDTYSHQIMKNIVVGTHLLHTYQPMLSDELSAFLFLVVLNHSLDRLRGSDGLMDVFIMGTWLVYVTLG